jgi:hypothetical protein
MSLLDLGLVLDIWTQELGTGSSLFGTLGSGDTRELDSGSLGRSGLSERFDDFSIHGLDGGFLSGCDERLRVDKFP